MGFLVPGISVQPEVSQKHQFLRPELAQGLVSNTGQSQFSIQLTRGMDKGTAKDFFPHFSGQRESNSEFTVGRLFVSILKKWENHRHIASPSLQTLGSYTVPWKYLCSNSIDCTGEVTVGNSSISCLNRPHWLRKSSNSCTWIKHNLSSVNTIHHPVWRMMSSVANVDSNPAKLFNKLLACSKKNNHAHFP